MVHSQDIYDRNKVIVTTSYIPRCNLTLSSRLRRELFQLRRINGKALWLEGLELVCGQSSWILDTGGTGESLCKDPGFWRRWEPAVAHVSTGWQLVVWQVRHKILRPRTLELKNINNYCTKFIADNKSRQFITPCPGSIN